MYTVVGHPRSRAMRVFWMLEELGRPYEIDPAPPHSPGVVAINPAGKIPALVADGEALTDSVAIVQFLADRHGVCTFPAGTLERARQDAMTQFCVDEIEGPLWTFSKHARLHGEDRPWPRVEEACRLEVNRALHSLAARLGDGPYLFGEAFTVPDLLLGHCADWAERGCRWELPKGRARDHLDRVRDRPALSRARRRAAKALAAA